MTRAHVFIFGGGPRLVSICTRLVRDSGRDLDVMAVDSLAAAAARAAGRNAPCIFLDARVAVDPAAFTAFIDHPQGLLAAAALDWSGGPASELAALKTDGTQDFAQLERHLTLAQPAPTIGSWLEPVGTRAEPHDAGVGPVRLRSYGWGISGYAMASRNLMIGLAHAGVEVAWSADFEIKESTEVAESDRALLRAMAAARRPNETQIVYHPPTFTDGRPFLDPYRRLFESQPAICMTMFETDRIPARWRDSLSRCEQIWVPTSFNIETFSASGVPREKLFRVPIGLDFTQTPIDGPRLNLGSRPGFTFLAVAEWTNRKGFDILLAAFARAFTHRDDVSLVIRSHYAKLDIAGEIARTLRDLDLSTDQLPPIHLIPQKLPQSELTALYRSADAFVLPTRGEGFGVPYLEAMALGVPTIGTAWGGNTDFLTPETGFPIGASLQSIDRKNSFQFPIFKGQKWAEPRIDATAHAMRTVFDDRNNALDVAARGAAFARARFNREITARSAIEALRELRPAKGRVRPRFGTIAFVGDLGSSNGTGSSARSAMRAIDASGIGSSARLPYVSKGSEIVRSDEAFFVKTRIARDFEPNDATIVHARLSDCSRLSIGSSTIVLTSVDEHVGDANVASTLNRAGAVCVSSAACAAILERHGVDARRLRVVPEAIDTDFWVAECGGLLVDSNDATFHFFALIDWQPESGWDTLVTAYTRAFAKNDRVSLSLNIVNRSGQEANAFGESCVRDLTAVLSTRFPERFQAATLPHFNVRVGTMAEEDLALMYGSHDAFVLLPRSRRAHRQFLEAMSSGLPTIAPRMGPHLAFMNDENSYLVGVRAAGPLQPADMHWQVDVDDAVAAMRRVVERPTEREEKSRAARRSVVSNNSLHAVGAALRAIVDEVRVVPRATIGADPRPPRKLCVVVLDSGSGALGACLEFLERNIATPDAHIVIRTDSPAVASATKARVTCVGSSLQELSAGFADATHVAFVDDRTRVGPVWDKLLIDSLESRLDAAVAVPQTYIPRDGKILDEAELGYDPQTLQGFDQAQLGRAVRLIGRGAFGNAFYFCCAVVDADALRRAVASSSDPALSPHDALCDVVTDHPRVWSSSDTFVHVVCAPNARFAVIAPRQPRHTADAVLSAVT